MSGCPRSSSACGEQPTLRSEVQHSHSPYSVHLEGVHEELQHGHGEEDVGAGGGGAGAQYDGQEHRLQ